MVNKRRARRAIESTYDGLCTVIEYRKVKDDVSKISSMKEIQTIKDQPCRLSFETLRSASQTDTATSVQQITKLFLPPELKIPPGSKIVVGQCGRSTAYKASGEAAVYYSHQEITLDLFDGWA